MASRPIVLTFSSGYPPGFKQGGPIRSLENLVNRLGDRLLFRVVTLDRYPGEPEPYAGVVADRWVKRGLAEVMYLSPGRAGVGGLIRVLRETGHDLLYLNSFFCPRFGLGLLWGRRRLGSGGVPVVVAPRGQFAPSALRIKSWKKRPCLAVAKGLGLTREVVWQATSEEEGRDTLRVFGSGARVVVAPNLGAVPGEWVPGRTPKRVGELRVVFLSRVARMKNLDGAIRMLGGVGGRVRFSIYGVIDDPVYWGECRALLERLPETVSWEFCGEVAPDRVGAVLAEQDVLFLPTLGENYGHVIVESWLAGCPVLVSDRTRWRGLKGLGVGWDVGLEDEAGFRAVLVELLGMEEGRHRELRERSRRYGEGVAADPVGVEENFSMFWGLVAGGESGTGAKQDL